MSGPADPGVRQRLAAKGINRDKLEEYAAAFKLFDSGSTGFITVDGLRFLLEEQFGACPCVGCRPAARVTVQTRARGDPWLWSIANPTTRERGRLRDAGASTGARGRAGAGRVCCRPQRPSAKSSATRGAVGEIPSAASPPLARKALVGFRARPRGAVDATWFAAPSFVISLRRTRAGQTYSQTDYEYMLRQFSGRDTDDPVDFETFATNLHAKMGDARYNEAFGDAFDLLVKESPDEVLTADLLKVRHPASTSPPSRSESREELG